VSLLAPILAAVLCMSDSECVIVPPKPKPAPPMQGALASWYDDAGTTASGTHYTLGFAALIFGSQWGHRVRFCYRGRCVVGQLDDHGPYIAGRLFDLGPALKATLGCPDLCWLRWRDA
jgi:rare lipoprotein A (peptidoglycan hydrolase)